MKKRYPYKFLDAYDSGDTDIFFGRDDEIDTLYKMAFQSDILLVYGASGTGKTSLINCGLANRFQSHDWLALNIRKGSDINESLRKKLETVAGDRATDEFDVDWFSDEEESTDTGTLTELESLLKSAYLKYFRPIYLIFDQFEELFVLGTKAEQAQFIQTVKEISAVEQPVKMIFVIREEYLGHLFEFEREVPELMRKKLRVEAMNLDKVGQVIRGSASIPGTNIHLEKGQEQDIVEDIFAKIRGKEKTLTIQLPYMQVFLDKLYMHIAKDEDRQADATFTLKALSEIGDIEDVLRDFLEEQAQQIQNQLEGEHPGLEEEVIWKILSPFATLEGTKEPLSEKALVQRLPDLSEAAISDALQTLDKGRILRYDENQELYEVAHDSLARRIADRRSDEEIALLEIRRLIKSQSALKEDARELFSEKQLNFIDPFLDKLALTDEEKDLIHKSREKVAELKEEERLQAEAEKQRLLERQRLLEKNQKAQRRFIGLMGIALVAMIGLSIWANGQRQKAIASAKKAEDNAELARIQTDSARTNAQLAEQRLDDFLRAQAISKAQEEESFGDNYRDYGNNNYACESYEKALSLMEGYEEDAYYKELKQKRDAVCQ